MYRLLLIFTLFICPFFVQAQDAFEQTRKEYNNASDRDNGPVKHSSKYATALFFP